MAIVDDTEQRLLEAAGQVFAEKGFRAATVREICQRAEANIAAVNYYFRDKQQLYDAVLQNAIRCKFDHLPLPQWPEGSPPAVKLRGFIRMVITQMVQTFSLPWQMQLLMREMSQPSDLGKGIVRDFSTFDADRLADHIAEFSLAALGLEQGLGVRG